MYLKKTFLLFAFPQAQLTGLLSNFGYLYLNIWTLLPRAVWHWIASYSWKIWTEMSLTKYVDLGWCTIYFFLIDKLCIFLVSSPPIDYFKSSKCFTAPLYLDSEQIKLMSKSFLLLFSNSIYCDSQNQGS